MNALLLRSIVAAGPVRFDEIHPEWHPALVELSLGESPLVTSGDGYVFATEEGRMTARLLRLQERAQG